MAKNSTRTSHDSTKTPSTTLHRLPTPNGKRSSSKNGGGSEAVKRSSHLKTLSSHLRRPVSSISASKDGRWMATTLADGKMTTTNHVREAHRVLRTGMNEGEGVSVIGSRPTKRATPVIREEEVDDSEAETEIADEELLRRQVEAANDDDNDDDYVEDGDEEEEEEDSEDDFLGTRKEKLAGSSKITESRGRRGSTASKSSRSSSLSSAPSSFSDFEGSDLSSLSSRGWTSDGPWSEPEERLLGIGTSGRERTKGAKGARSIKKDHRTAIKSTSEQCKSLKLGGSEVGKGRSDRDREPVKRRPGRPRKGDSSKSTKKYHDRHQKRSHKKSKKRAIPEEEDDDEEGEPDGEESAVSSARVDDRSQCDLIANPVNDHVEEDDEIVKRPPGRRKVADLSDPNRRDRAGRTQLFRFTGSGDLEMVEMLIASGADVNIRDYAGWTALHEACLNGQTSTVDFLIKHSADVNACGLHDDTPLHDACSNGYPQVVELLLKNGANAMAKNAKGLVPLDVCEDPACQRILERRIMALNHITARDKAGQTSLHRACFAGGLEDVGVLLDQGADINARDNALWTPLHEASLNGHLEVVELLLKRGAQVNTRGYQDDTPLHDASQNGHEAVVRVLMEYGADPDFKNSKGETPKDVAGTKKVLRLLKSGVEPVKKLRSTSVTSDFPVSPTIVSNLMHADKPKRECSIDTMSDSDQSQTVSARKNPMSREERKLQQLMRTIKKMEKQEERKKHGAKRGRPRRDEDEEDDEEEQSRAVKVNSSTSAGRVRGRRKRGNSTASRRSASEDLAEGTRSQSEEAEETSGPPPKIRKASHGNVVQASIEPRRGLDPRHKDTSGRTHLHKCSARGDVVMVEQLLKNGAGANVCDHAGWTPLHEAALAGHLDVVNLLLAYGADVNAKGGDLDTPLHDAIENGHTNVVGILLSNGAEPDAKNAAGKTPIDLASENEEIMDMLRKTMEEQIDQGDDAGEEGEDSSNMEDISKNNVRSQHHEVESRKNDESKAAKRGRGRPRKNSGIVSVMGVSKRNRKEVEDIVMTDTNPTSNVSEPHDSSKRHRSPEGKVSQLDHHVPKRRLVSGTELRARSNSVERPGTYEDVHSTPVQASSKPREIVNLAMVKTEEGKMTSFKSEHGLATAVDASPLASTFPNDYFKLDSFDKAKSRSSSPAPTPPPETWKDAKEIDVRAKIKKEREESIYLLSGTPATSPTLKLQAEDHISDPCQTLSQAKRYLPLYTVQLKEHNDIKTPSSSPNISTISTSHSPTRSFFVVDLQVRLLLGIPSDTLFASYPHLFRRLITDREKERLWSPLASMVSERCAAAVKINAPIGMPIYDDDKDEVVEGRYCSTAEAIARLKEREKQKFVQMELYFVKLDEIVGIIKKDFEYLSGNLITITLDIGYSDGSGIDVRMDTVKDGDIHASKRNVEETVTQSIPTRLTTDKPPTSTIMTSSPNSPTSTSPSPQNVVTNLDSTASPSLSGLTVAPISTPIVLIKRPAFGLPPKFAMKMKKQATVVAANPDRVGATSSN